jgi:hypothetical protein
VCNEQTRRWGNEKYGKMRELIMDSRDKLGSLYHDRGTRLGEFGERLEHR